LGFGVKNAKRVLDNDGASVLGDELFWLSDGEGFGINVGIDGLKM